MADLQLYRVTVTQTWSAEAEALVLAESRLDAETAACREVEIDVMDAEYDGNEASAYAVSAEVATGLTKLQADNLWLIMPDKKYPDQWETVKFEEFMRAFTPEELERARIARIERDNGQLALEGLTHA